jgi:hypothetical protein
VEGIHPPCFVAEFEDKFIEDVKLWKLLERQYEIFPFVGNKS